ncbi:MAG TPA: tetratricopeptide repeat protein [Bacteroidia bacterium]
MIPKNGNTSGKKRWLLLPFFVLGFFLANIWSACAVVNSDFEKANEYYHAKDYQHAIQLYKRILETGVESPALYFNLGNCYFKSDSIARAILYYEKAKKLAPSDEDIQFNLKIAGQRVTDRIEAPSSLFFTAWWENIKMSKTIDQWGWLCVSCILLTFMSFATFWVFSASTIKKYGFWGGLFFLLLTIFTFTLAEIRYSESVSSSEAIIMVDAISVKSSPEEKGKEIFILHSGCKLQVINTNGQWSEIRLANNNVGWVPTSSIEFI